MAFFSGRRSRTARPDIADAEDKVAFLVNEHGAALQAYALRLTGDRHTAEDVVQETLVRAWKRLDQLAASAGSVRGYLLTVARNIVIDQARARAIRPQEVAETPLHPPVSADHADAVVDLIAMGSLLDTLSTDHRDVLVQLYYLGRTASEAATALGVPVGTVKSRSYHALRALRTQFASTAG